jgi:hypothetical protein
MLVPSRIRVVTAAMCVSRSSGSRIGVSGVNGGFPSAEYGVGGREARGKHEVLGDPDRFESERFRALRDGRHLRVAEQEQRDANLHVALPPFTRKRTTG